MNSCSQFFIGQDRTKPESESFEIAKCYSEDKSGISLRVNLCENVLSVSH